MHAKLRFQVSFITLVEATKNKNSSWPSWSLCLQICGTNILNFKSFHDISPLWRKQHHLNSLLSEVRFSEAKSVRFFPDTETPPVFLQGSYLLKLSMKGNGFENIERKEYLMGLLLVFCSLYYYLLNFMLSMTSMYKELGNNLYILSFLSFWIF